MEIDTTLLSWYFLIFSGAYNMFFIAYHLLQRVYINDRKPPVSNNETISHSKNVGFVTAIIPARDEELVIESSVVSILNALKVGLPDIQYEILAIDDASQDQTLSILNRIRDEYPDQVLLAERTSPHCREGKAAVLNDGIKILLDRFDDRDPARWIIGVFDADAYCEGELFESVANVFCNQDADAVQCGVRIQNTRSKWLPRLQDVEFLSFAGIMQPVRSSFSGGVMLGGNAQFVRMSSLMEAKIADGEFWDPQALTEDLDLGLRLHCNEGRIEFSPSIVYQQGLETWRALLKQRMRWGWGMVQAWVGTLLKRNSFWKSGIPWYRKLDILYYLTFWLIPILVALTWLLTFLSLVTNLTIQNSFQPWFLILISFSYFPLFLIGVYGWYPLRSVKTWLAVFLTVIYTYHWIPAMLFGVWAVVSRQEPLWDKTERLDPHSL